MPKLSIPINEMNAFDLPKVCVITGEANTVNFKPVKFQWYPRWIALFAPLALLPAAILAQILTRKVKGELPFTDAAFSAWRRGRVFFGLSFLLAVASLILIPLLIGVLGDAYSGVATMVGICGLIGIPTGAWFAFLRGKQVTVAEISKTHVILNVPSEQAVKAITNHLLAGEARVPAAQVPSVKAIG